MNSAVAEILTVVEDQDQDRTQSGGCKTTSEARVTPASARKEREKVHKFRFALIIFHSKTLSSVHHNRPQWRQGYPRKVQQEFQFNRQCNKNSQERTSLHIQLTSHNPPLTPVSRNLSGWSTLKFSFQSKFSLFVVWNLFVDYSYCSCHSYMDSHTHVEDPTTPLTIAMKHQALLVHSFHRPPTSSFDPRNRTLSCAGYAEILGGLCPNTVAASPRTLGAACARAHSRRLNL